MSEITEVSGGPARSGKRARIMVSCVVTEVSAVVDPVKFYETDKVYLIHYIREKDNPRLAIYQEFYDEVVRRIGEVRPTAEIVEVSEPVYYYHDMLRAVLGIYDREKEATGGNMDLYVNLTTGRAEYAAAAMMASMLHNDIVAFTVRAEEKMLTPEEYRKVFYDGDRPVGQYRTVKYPTRVQTFDPSILDGDYLDYLVAIDEVNEKTRKPLIRDYIDKLESEGLWDYVPDQKKTKTPDEQKKRMQFNRCVTGPLIEKGFINPAKGTRGRFELTDAGKAALRVLKKQRNPFQYAMPWASPKARIPADIRRIPAQAPSPSAILPPLVSDSEKVLHLIPIIRIRLFGTMASRHTLQKIRSVHFEPETGRWPSPHPGGG